MAKAAKKAKNSKKKGSKSSSSGGVGFGSLFRLVLALTVMAMTFWMAGVMKKDDHTLLQLLDAKVGMEAFQPIHERLFGPEPKGSKANDGVEQALDEVEKRRTKKRKASSSPTKSKPRHAAQAKPPVKQEQAPAPHKEDKSPAKITQEDQQALDKLINEVAP